MLKVPMSQAAPGMTLAMPLHHPQTPGRLLLKTGYVLDSSDIERLRELQVREIWARFPSLDFLCEHVNPAVIALQQELAAGIERAFEGVANHGEAEFDYQQFRETIGVIIEMFSTHPKAAYYISEVCVGGKTHIAHAANACSLSLLMGLRLQSYVAQQRSRLHPRYAKNVVNLGVGAMLHDIGMLQLDPETLDRWARTQNENDTLWREHVQNGYSMVRAKVGPSAASIVLNHHQRFDGTGFPERQEADGNSRALDGEHIPVFARIVAVADVFDRLRNPPDGSPPRAAVEAQRALLHDPWVTRLDPMCVKALITVAPPYPPGAVVTLSDGREGVVTKWSPAEPCRPTVRILANLTEDEGEEKAETVDLLENESLEVVFSEGRDVSRSNFYSTRPDDLDVDAAQAILWRRLVDADGSLF